MDLLLGVGIALAIGLPWAGLMLSQATATPSGYQHSAPARELSEQVREVGTSGDPLVDVPTSLTSDGAQ